MSINPQRMRGCINPVAQSTGELLTIVGMTVASFLPIAMCILVVLFDSLACMHAWHYSA